MAYALRLICMDKFGSGCRAGWSMLRLGVMLGGVALGMALCGRAVCGQAVPAAGGADAGTAATLHAEVRLVSVPVVVRDKKGALVKGLTKSDFALAVDGKVQVIRYFDLDRDAPLVLGLLVDTSMSQRAVLDDERVASTAFLEQMLTKEASGSVAGDKAFVLQFAHEAELLQDVTESKPKLQAALKEIDASGTGARDDATDDSGNGQDGSGNGHRGGRGGYGGHGGTVLYDAVYLGSNEVMAKQKGRKALVILSDGDDRGSKETLAKAIEAAQRADTVVYAIYFKGQEHGGYGDHGGGHGGSGGGRGGHGGGGYPGGGGNQGGGGYPGGGGRGDQVDGKKVLQRMCDETGGRLFEVKGKQTVAAIYTQIEEELRSQYRLGYSPDAANAAEGYHKVDVTVPSQPKDSVQARDGYYGK